MKTVTKTKSAYCFAFALFALGGAQLMAQDPESKPTGPRKPADAVTPAMVKQNRHEGIMKNKSKGEIGLLFLGDSITDRFQTFGKDIWAKYAPYKPADFGVGGDRTENVLWRITNGELDGLKPKVTVVLIGTNNIGQCPDEKPEWAAAGVKKVVETVHAKMPGTKVLLLGVFPRGEKPNDPLRLKVAEINKLISKFDDGVKTRYLDISKSLLQPDGTLSREVMKDRLHPTEHGYEIWYDAMKPLLDEMMR